MSLFLEPIHYSLYNKIEVQNKIVNRIIEELNLNEINRYLDNKFGYLDDKPLEKIINNVNMYYLLQNKVNVLGNRLAYTIKYVLEKDKKYLFEIKNIFSIFGANVNIEGDKNNTTVIFKAIENNLLDSMSILEKSYDNVIFEMNYCVYKKYFDNFKIDINIYYELVNEFIFGVLSCSTSTFWLEKIANIYEIYKEK